MCVLMVRALLVGAYIRATDYWQQPYIHSDHSLEAATKVDVPIGTSDKAKGTPG